MRNSTPGDPGPFMPNGELVPPRLRKSVELIYKVAKELGVEPFSKYYKCAEGWHYEINDAVMDAINKKV